MAGVRPLFGRLYWQGAFFSSPAFNKSYHISCAALGRFGKARPPVAQKHLFLKDEDARDFIYTLKATERSILLSQLTKFEEERLKTTQTGKHKYFYSFSLLKENGLNFKVNNNKKNNNKQPQNSQLSFLFIYLLEKCF